MKAKRSVGPLTNENGVLTQDGKPMAEILNNKFASVFTVENIATVPTVATSLTFSRGIEPMEIGTIQEQEVQKYFDKLDINKSTGPDNLTPKLL